MVATAVSVRRCPFHRARPRARPDRRCKLIVGRVAVSNAPRGARDGAMHDARLHQSGLACRASTLQVVPEQSPLSMLLIRHCVDSS